MKRFAIASSAVALLLVAGCALFLYMRRDEPTVACVPLDHGTRTRQFCIMNPFRDRQAEAAAEQILEELKQGNTKILVPFLADRAEDDREQYLNNESEYRITSWHNGEVETNGEELRIRYWVSRSNYPPGREEVNFVFARTEGRWSLRSYNAIY
jgi:hypothetical protein